MSGTNGLTKRRSKGPASVAVPPAGPPAKRAAARASSVPSGPVSRSGSCSKRPFSSRHAAGASRPIVPSGDFDSSRTKRPRPRVASTVGAVDSISPSTETRKLAPASSRRSASSIRARSTSFASKVTFAGSPFPSARRGSRPRALRLPPRTRAVSVSISASRPRKRARSLSSLQRPPSKRPRTSSSDASPVSSGASPVPVTFSRSAASPSRRGSREHEVEQVEVGVALDREVEGGGGREGDAAVERRAPCAARRGAARRARACPGRPRGGRAPSSTRAGAACRRHGAPRPSSAGARARGAAPRRSASPAR